MKVSKVIRKSNIWIKSDTRSITINDEKINKVYFNGFVKCFKFTFSDGSDFTCTPNHMLKSNDYNWTSASNINVGFTTNNQLTVISKEKTGYEPTMDIEVPVSHEYYLENGTLSHNSSQICGTVSQGIEPLLANTFQQELAGGIVSRINPTLLRIMTERNVLSQELIDSIGKEHDGSVQHVDWLTPVEKQVFKTGYEIDQRVCVDLAADRQPKICQAQSLNLQFKADTPAEVISDIHLYAAFNKHIKSLYYMRTQPSSKGSDGTSAVVDLNSCESCAV